MALDPLTAGIDLARATIDKIWPDASEEQRNKINLILEANRQQNDINKISAANPSLFNSGPRSFVLWVLGLAFAWNFLASPILVAIFAAFGVELKLPGLDVALMVKTLFAMLGIAGT